MCPRLVQKSRTLWWKRKKTVARYLKQKGLENVVNLLLLFLQNQADLCPIAITPAPHRASPTPTTSVHVGGTPSTSHSQPSAVAM